MRPGRPIHEPLLCPYIASDDSFPRPEQCDRGPARAYVQSVSVGLKTVERKQNAGERNILAVARRVTKSVHHRALPADSELKAPLLENGLLLSNLQGLLVVSNERFTLRRSGLDRASFFWYSYAQSARSRSPLSCRLRLCRLLETLSAPLLMEKFATRGLHKNGLSLFRSSSPGFLRPDEATRSLIVPVLSTFSRSETPLLSQVLEQGPGREQST